MSASSGRKASVVSDSNSARRSRGLEVEVMGAALSDVRSGLLSATAWDYLRLPATICGYLRCRCASASYEAASAGAAVSYVFCATPTNRQSTTRSWLVREDMAA